MSDAVAISRRAFVAGSASSLLLIPGRLLAEGDANRVILLGTKGGPTPSAQRAPASVLLVVGGRPYLVDTPNGVAGQLAKAGVGLPALTQIFITHNHSDHVIDAGSLMVLA